MKGPCLLDANHFAFLLQKSAIQRRLLWLGGKDRHHDLKVNRHAILAVISSSAAVFSRQSGLTCGQHTRSTVSTLKIWNMLTLTWHFSSASEQPDETTAPAFVRCLLLGTSLEQQT